MDSQLLALLTAAAFYSGIMITSTPDPITDTGISSMEMPVEDDGGCRMSMTQAVMYGRCLDRGGTPWVYTGGAQCIVFCIEPT